MHSIDLEMVEMVEVADPDLQIAFIWRNNDWKFCKYNEKYIQIWEFQQRKAEKTQNHTRHLREWLRTKDKEKKS